MNDSKTTGQPGEVTADIAADLAALKADLARLAESVAAIVGEEGAAVAAGVKRRARSAAAQAEATATQFAEGGRAAVDETRARIHELGDDVAGVVERNPLAALAAALGLGIVIGMMSRRHD